MGYTRYWERTEKALTEDFVKKVERIIKDSAALGIAIRGWDGTGDPELTTERISFNGNGKADKDLSNESFVLGSGDDGFDFCKTARKPYDYAVRMVLQAAEKDGFVTNVSSDGENNVIYSDEQFIRGWIDYPDL